MEINTSENSNEVSKNDKKIRSAPANELKPNLSGMTEALYRLYFSIPHGFRSIRRLPEEIFKIIFKYLLISESSVADATFRIADKQLLGTESFFKSSLNEAKAALPLLQAVISGNLGANPEEENEHSLMHLVRKNPAALFMKGDISFPNGCDVYLLPTLPEDLSEYKGHYIWVNQKQLIYVHYDVTREDVLLNDIDYFNQAIQSLPTLPKHTVYGYEKDSVALTNNQINELITKYSQNQHKPIPHQRFYNVSPFQLIQFFCDDDMQNHIMRLISPLQEKQGQLIKEQLEELGPPGAADIIKVNRNPLDPTFEFENILHYQASYITAYRNNRLTTQEINHSLLEKPTGLIYYKDVSGQVHWYRADMSTQSIEPIDNPLDHPEKRNAFSEKDQQAFAAMVNDIDQMEDMSSLQSSQEKRRLISKILDVHLHQAGINFELEGVRFKGGCYDFNRQDNTYRKCHRLYEANKKREGDTTWNQELGHRQKECAWKLLRLCEKDRRLYPFPENYKSTEFKRGFNFDPSGMGVRTQLLLSPTRHFAPNFGTMLAIYKGTESMAKQCCTASLDYDRALDLVAGVRLVEDAKANMFKRVALTPSGLDIPNTHQF